MANVIVDTLHCIAPTDADDALYMLTFRGNTIPPYESNVTLVGPNKFWDGIDSGDVLRQEEVIAAYRDDAVYVVTVVEQDFGFDIDINNFGLWKTQTAVAWKAVMISQSAAGLPSSQEPQRTAAATGIITACLAASSAAIRAPYDPDAPIGSPQRLVVFPGKAATLEFVEASKAGRGHYRIAFKVA